MPSRQPRTPEVEVSESDESGFVAAIRDGDHLVQVRPHENGYQVSLAAPEGRGDAAFLGTYTRAERFRRTLERSFAAVDADAVFDVLDDHFGDAEYRIASLTEGMARPAGRGAQLRVETGEPSPASADDGEERDDEGPADATFRVDVWPTADQYTEVRERDDGEPVAKYWPNSHPDSVRNGEQDDHERERAPTSVPGVHAPVDSGTLAKAPVVHTAVHCPHLTQLQRTQFTPAGEEPPSVPADGSGELPLRWCSSCADRFPTPAEIREQYGPK